MLASNTWSVHETHRRENAAWSLIAVTSWCAVMAVLRRTLISCNDKSPSNFGNIVLNVLTEAVDVLTDLTGWCWKHAIDSSSLKAKTIDSTKVEMCPQQKSPCTRNCNNLYWDSQKHTHKHTSVQSFMHAAYTYTERTRSHLYTNTGTSFQHRKADRNTNPEVHYQ